MADKKPCAPWEIAAAPYEEKRPLPYEPDQGRKDDGDKIRTDLYPPAAYLSSCRALTYGAGKYDAWNWTKGLAYTRVYGALLRHLFAWFCGEAKDPESGLHHLDHAGCCLAFLQHYESDLPQYRSFDDRPSYFKRGEISK
jgi:hypothetical protein